ncbi:MAG: hypothetical protein J6Q19_00805 [Bacteroidaceae bacterium]|nr:hypothetical protein [Bacteroidaceae bacterium]
MKLNTRNDFRIVLALMFLFLPAANLFAQFEQEDPFADDFEIDQPVVRRNVRRGQWVPSTY